MTAYLKTTNCCGLGELTDIISSEGSAEPARSVLINVSEKILEAKRPFIVFSCPTKYKVGAALMGYIRAQKLGTCLPTATKLNLNSGNKLKVYTWTVDHDALRKWGDKNLPFKFSPGHMAVITGQEFDVSIPIVGSLVLVVGDGGGPRVSVRCIKTEKTPYWTGGWAISPQNLKYISRDKLHEYA